jgi:hypothetical protein
MHVLRPAKLLLLATSLLLLCPRNLHAQAPALPTTADAAAEMSDEQVADHEGRWMRAIAADLIAEKFDDLDRLADQCRREKAALPGGAWRLRLFYEALDAPYQSDKDTLDHLAHLEAWMKLRPESITPRIALATSLHRWAWVARGSGTANTVTADGWRLFNERIQESQAVLKGSANMRTMDPQFYSEEMIVGLAQGWDQRQEQEVFERGVQFEPEYTYLYKQYADYLLPKWYGQPTDAANFARKSADHLGGDAGDMLYFQIAGTIVKRGNGNMKMTDGVDWQRIQRGYKALDAKYGHDKRQQNELAFMAYKFNDAAVARQQFALIGDNWARNVWKQKQFYDRIRDWSQGAS